MDITVLKECPTSPFISNQFVEANPSFDILNPTTGQTLTKLTQASDQQIKEAFERSRQASESYSLTSPQQRSVYLQKIKEALQKNIQILTQIETMDSGKPYTQSYEDMMICIQAFEYFSHRTYLQGRSNQDYSSNIKSETRREPLGVIGMITPWNFPLVQAVLKIAPALAFGNTILLKPSEHSSLSCLFLGKLVSDILPKDVLNIVTGEGNVGQYLGQMPLDGINFTGSTLTGSKILTQSAQFLRKTGVELGGKSCSVVDSDVDLDNAVEKIFWGCMYNMGQNCVASTRVYVHQEVYEEFCQKMRDFCLKNVKIGDPMDKENNFGPINNQIQFNKIQSYIQKARDDKINFLVDPNEFEIPKNGLFQAPIIINNVEQDHPCAREEIFGPFMTILKPFSTHDEAIQKANDTLYGLGGAVFTNNMKTTEFFVRRLKAGNIWVNTYNYIPVNMPFGGYKQSGFSKETGDECIEEYTLTKSVYYDFN